LDLDLAPGALPIHVTGRSSESRLHSRGVPFSLPYSPPPVPEDNVGFRDVFRTNLSQNRHGWTSSASAEQYVSPDTPTLFCDAPSSSADRLFYERDCAQLGSYPEDATVYHSEHASIGAINCNRENSSYVPPHADGEHPTWATNPPQVRLVPVTEPYQTWQNNGAQAEQEGARAPNAQSGGPLTFPSGSQIHTLLGITPR